MLNARTTASFEMNTSLREIGIFWGIMIGIILSLMFPSIFGLFFILGGILYLAYRRAIFRTKIREKLSISGNFTDDFARHICCSCCAVCQEAREANESSLLLLDYCSGERIEMQEIAHDIATGRINATLQTPSSDDGGTFWSHLLSISMTSKIILFLCGTVSMISFVIIFLVHKERNLIVLFLTFLQPILILYFVYWKSRRQYATLDMVIKLFAVGFWLTTFQSVIFEEILQGLLLLILGPFIATSFIVNDDQAGDDYYVPSDSSPTGEVSQYLPRSYFHKIFAIFQKLQLKSSAEMRYGEFNYYKNESFPYEDPTSSLNQNDDNDDEVRHKMKQNIWLVVLVVFLMAFVVAAGVEETMKHFSVRCCRFPAPLSDPHTILVYLMASALGFATSENIEYVFGASTSPIPGTSVFVGELIVLFVRVLMPVHVICSVIQAANLSKVILGQQRMSLVWILLPAIALHGAFDFVLMFIGAFQFVYQVEGIGLEIASFVIALCITIGGALYAYSSFKKVQDSFLSGWQTFEDEESNAGNDRL